MVKRTIGRKDYAKVIVFIVLATITIFSVVAVLITRGSYAPSLKNQQIPDGKAVMEGLAVCLPHKNTDGPQTLECAIGIKDDKGMYYSLSDTDGSYANVSKIQTGKRYEIIGNLEERSDPNYQTSGYLRIEKIKEL